MSLDEYGKDVIDFLDSLYPKLNELEWSFCFLKELIFIGYSWHETDNNDLFSRDDINLFNRVAGNIEDILYQISIYISYTKYIDSRNWRWLICHENLTFKDNVKQLISELILNEH